MSVMHSKGTNNRQRTKRQCKFSMNDQNICFFFVNIYHLYLAHNSLCNILSIYLIHFDERDDFPIDDTKLTM